MVKRSGARERERKIMYPAVLCVCHSNILHCVVNCSTLHSEIWKLNFASRVASAGYPHLTSSYPTTTSISPCSTPRFAQRSLPLAYHHYKSSDLPQDDWSRWRRRSPRFAAANVRPLETRWRGWFMLTNGVATWCSSYCKQYVLSCNGERRLKVWNCPLTVG